MKNTKQILHSIANKCFRKKNVQIDEEWNKPVDIEGTDKDSTESEEMFLVLIKQSTDDSKKIFGLYDTIEEAKEALSLSEQMKIKRYADQKLSNILKKK